MNAAASEGPAPKRARVVQNSVSIGTANHSQINASHFGELLKSVEIKSFAKYLEELNVQVRFLNRLNFADSKLVYPNELISLSLNKKSVPPQELRQAEERLAAFTAAVRKRTLQLSTDITQLVRLEAEPKILRNDADCDPWHYIMSNSIKSVFLLGPNKYRLPMDVHYTDLDYDMGSVEGLKVECEFSSSWPTLDYKQAERVCEHHFCKTSCKLGLGKMAIASR
jgi:hypothetical protein